ncbi:MAG: thiamine phosphate synthase, partial [Pseudomonadota bacterium]|nr:thiamine phosphate synthase [Pseudomonadota bacterium]
KGIRLILMREPEMNEGQRAQLFRRIQPFVKNKGGELLFHGMPRVARLVEADGIHLNSIELMRLASRPDFRICAASVHDAKQIEQAVRMNLDFIVLSPVMKTKSHPDKAPLGWPAFSRLIRDCPIPVFAMGGLQQVQLNEAMKSGAHGIAMQRAVWPLSHVCRNKNDSGELE